MNTTLGDPETSPGIPEQPSLPSPTTSQPYTLGEAMETATTMFPHKPTPVPTKGTLPHHLLPNKIRYDISYICRRTKAICRLVNLEARSPDDNSDDLLHLDTLLSLWRSINTPLMLRIKLFPPPRDFKPSASSHRRILMRNTGTVLPPGPPSLLKWPS